MSRGPVPDPNRFARRGSGRRRIRRGLVLGAGGVLGAAWLAGALAALQDCLGRALYDLEIVVGTSAGSVLAAALHCGVGVDTIVAHQRGVDPVALPDLADIDRDSGRLPPWPRLRLGSPRLIATTARAPHRVHPFVAASALVPPGRARHTSLHKLIHALVAHRHGGSAPAEHTWSPGRTWIVAVDYDTGRRVAFGRPGAPEVSLPDAVVASCSIPGWYEPKLIDQRRYVDGGVRSTTSLDLLARAELDEVFVLAPMASHENDNPHHPAVRAERLVRQWINRGLAQEVNRVRASGAAVTLLTPGAEDLEAMGANLMDPARRQRVLETSLRTSPVRLAALHPHDRAA